MAYDQELIMRIVDVLSGNSWDTNTAPRIAQILDQGGYPIDDMYGCCYCHRSPMQCECVKEDNHEF